MPTWRLGTNPTAIRRFDVIGQESSSEPEFVGHLALAAEERGDCVAPMNQRVVHMRPPLRLEGRCQTDWVGSAGLSEDEETQIRVFYEELRLEYKAAKVRDPRKQYVICPHVENQYDNGTVLYRRFSCVGFVLEAYREAGINMLFSELESLPPVKLDALKSQYPDFTDILESPSEREKFGIPGEGPWPVILAGYILNALDRPEGEIRSTTYLPRAGDEFFPARGAETSGLGARSAPTP